MSTTCRFIKNTNDVLYISGPLKTQNIDPSTSDRSKAGIPNCKQDNLQSFQLIAPDNFMIYQALSVNHNIDSTKPLEQKISDMKTDLPSTSNEELSARKINNESDNNASDDKNFDKFDCDIQISKYMEWQVSRQLDFRKSEYSKKL